MTFQAGQQVTFTHYGETRRGTIHDDCASGNVVMVRDELGHLRWLHRVSVAPA